MKNNEILIRDFKHTIEKLEKNSVPKVYSSLDMNSVPKIYAWWQQPGAAPAKQYQVETRKLRVDIFARNAKLSFMKNLEICTGIYCEHQALTKRGQKLRSRAKVKDPSIYVNTRLSSDIT